MSRTPSSQETPIPASFSDLVSTLRFPAPAPEPEPEPEPRQRTHDPTWDKLIRNVPKTEADWQTIRRRYDFNSAERIPDTLARLLDPLEEGNLHKIIFLAGCNACQLGDQINDESYQKAMYNLAQPDLENVKDMRAMEDASPNVVSVNGWPT
ncbi:hypothetical protein F53441_2330 [Fusarium austroafricanum]|uniref:Uncharacterized protein n=1 Tax=Fusarium austroafricanum TaxID=2364996 RepID=A0A8H4KRL4_9HYPO|nr:hypothetical protein F53441_2330 [Fusarium austroafricanum]